MTPDERRWIVPFSDQAAVDALEAALLEQEAAEERAARSNREQSDAITMARYGGLKIQIFAGEHPPPHFHVSCGGARADYSIKDCRQLKGGLRREYRTIRKWYAANRQRLIAAWNAFRPTGCPVGPYQDD